MSGSAFAVTHYAFSSGAGRTSDGNGSHASTLKSPSYTKSVSWQHHPLQDVDMLIYVHGANDPESRLPAGLLDIGVSKRQIAVISKTDMPDADVAATRKLLLETGFEEPIFELNSHDPQSVQQLVDYLASLTKQEEAGEKTHHSE
ncbi:TPA: hypothetical protein OF428_003445 [Escherichia coli]|nr:hypothetical protein [Escherichia coli]